MDQGKTNPEGSQKLQYGGLMADGSRNFENSLGNYTKSSSPLKSSTPSATKATEQKKGAENVHSEREAHEIAQRSVRYALQNEARRLHLSEVEDDLGGLEALNEAHRVCKCKRTRVNPEVQIKRSEDNGKAFYTGLSVCGSVWVCPVCNGKIQEVRRKEVAHGVAWAYKNGYTVTMITFTFPHYRFQSCKDLLEKQAAAFKYFRGGKVWQKWKEKVGFKGLIRSLEVNYGQNGWHPHTHELWIHKDIDLREMQKFCRFVADHWKKACLKQGLIPRGKIRAFNEHAVDFKCGASNSDYLAKTDDQSTWGVDSEMTKSSLKDSKKGRSAFALLADSAKGCKKSGALFLEYSEAFKGKSQLFWSKGLKKMAGVDQLSDEEIADHSQEESTDICKLEMFAWMAVCDKDARALILTIAEKEGYEGVYNWLAAYGVHDTGSASWR